MPTLMLVRKSVGSNPTLIIIFLRFFRTDFRVDTMRIRGDLSV
jgi:hypothetical protein